MGRIQKTIQFHKTVGWILFVAVLIACSRDESSISSEVLEQPALNQFWVPEWVKEPNYPGIPQNWMEVSSPLDSPVGRHCMGRASSGNWRVKKDSNDRLLIQEYTGTSALTPLQFSEMLSLDPVGLAPQYAWIRVEDGFLVGFDRGKSGNGLWWLSTDGTRKKRLINESCPVRGMREIEDRILVFCGVLYAFGPPGQIIEIFKEEKTWKATTNARLEDPISAIASVDGDSSSAFFVSGNTVFRWENGKIARVLNFENEKLNANSLEAFSDGSFVLGGRHAILVLDFLEDDPSERERWFVPADCVNLKTLDGTANCKCSSTS